MSVHACFYDEVPPCKLQLNSIEVANRLHTAVGYTDDLIDECKQLLLSVMNCKYSAVLCDFSVVAKDVVDIGFGNIHSHALYLNLQHAKCGYIFVATLGAKVDMLIKSLALSSPSKAFIVDGLASAYAEALAEYVDNILTQNKVGRHRFSPGYGDLSLCVQPEVLRITNATKLLGVTLSKDMFMTPAKTITAIKGIIKDD